MKNFTLSVLLGLLLAANPFSSHAQDRCGMEEYMEEMMKDPEYARQYEEKQKALKQRLQEYLNNSDLYQRQGTIEIPVAVHFPEASEAERSCLEALAQNQIDILNADYTATNSDISSWNAISSQYPGTNTGIANISFCIATSNHPTGLDPELLEGNPCITIGYDFGGGSNVDANWSGYLNFVVRNIPQLGFSPLFGDISDGDAVTMDNNAFGSGAGCTSVVPGAPYNLGRTTTHELGHFFGLQHTFNADGGGICGSGGDGIADTPEVANSTYGCPNPPTSVPSCTPGQPALTMNYMDYVNDACMYMFSQDQMTLAEAYISSIQADIKPNVCQPVSPGFVLSTNDNEIFSCPTTDTEAIYNFTYSTVLGFSETTTFGASGLPSGATASFSPTSLNSDGNFTMTVGNLDIAAQGNFTITVTGTSASVTETIDVELTNQCTEVVCNDNDSAANLGIPIPDPSGGNAGIASDVLTISESATIESLTVTVDVSHTWISDLRVYLLPPNWNTFPSDAVVLWNNECGVSAGSGYDNFVVTFDDTGVAFPGTDGCSNNFTGTYSPNEPLDTFADLDTQGDWTLVIADFFSGDTGTLNNWSIEFCERQLLNTSNFEIDNLSVYPNPNNGTFNIGFSPKSGEEISIQVYDIRGRAIYENTYNSVGRFDEVIQLNHAESGVYLLSISDGPQKVTKKIVVD